ncbi:hypothetical protein AJ87_09115 [Rhizobium yanglingense]|nr:hypothetical protein AJ87_09115 [Rhizobium yanglingense]
MDIYSLAITHIHAAARPLRMSAWEEESYYSNHKGGRHFGPVLLGSIAMAVGVIMMLGMNSV